jgi:hypothetical protein
MERAIGAAPHMPAEARKLNLLGGHVQEREGTGVGGVGGLVPSFSSFVLLPLLVGCGQQVTALGGVTPLAHLRIGA